MPDTATTDPCRSSAAEEEDRLLQTLAGDLQQERQQRLQLLDDIERLQQALGCTSTALAQAKADLARLQRCIGSDALTGLPNRRGFDQPSRRALASHGADQQGLALLFVDLDGFKAVNDRLGHPVGDELLRIIGARLAAAVRQDDLVCRHGGDEFLCLLPRIAMAEHATSIAAGLIEAISAPCQIGRHRLQVRASIGVALFPRDGRSVGALVRRADAAMYQAKALGCGIALAGTLANAVTTAGPGRTRAPMSASAGSAGGSARQAAPAPG